MPKKADAYIGGFNPEPGWGIPADQRDILAHCDERVPIQSPGFVRWISIAGNPLQQDISVPKGTTTIPLELHLASVVCTGRSAVLQTTFQFGPIISPGAESLWGQTTFLNHTVFYGPGNFNNVGTYRHTSVRFNYSPPGGFNTSGDRVISVDTRSINQFASGVRLCVGNGVRVANDYEFAPCTISTPSFVIRVNVIDRPTTIGIDASGSCNAITGWAWDEDVPLDPVRIDMWSEGGTASGVGLTSVQANIPDPYVNNTWPITGNSPHRFSIDVRPYINYATNGPRTFYLYFLNRNSDGVPSSWELRTVNVNVPNCGTPFSLVGTGNVTLDPDDEDATSAKFTNMGVSGFSPTINGVTVSRKYTLIRAGQPDVDLGSPSNLTNQTIGSGGLAFPDEIKGLPGIKAGDQICYTITLNPGAGRVSPSTGTVISGSGTAVSSPPACKTIANKPYVSFYGNDVKAGGGFEVGNTGTCTLNTTSSITTSSSAKGSGSVQFAGFALGAITNFATASLRSSTPVPPDGLKFANFGSYGANSCTHDYYNDVVSAVPAATPWAGGVLPTTNGVKYKATGPVSISTSNIPSGAHVYVYVDGDVTINGNISMNQGAWTDKSQIPSFYLVVKGNIYINKSVDRIDGVYVAQRNTPTTKGIIYTCTSGNTPVATADLYDECGTQLTVNGAFLSQKVALLRTFGSLRAAGNDNPYPSGTLPKSCPGKVSSTEKVCAAEVFNFSPSLYIADSPGPATTSNASEREYQYYSLLPPIL